MNKLPEGPEDPFDLPADLVHFDVPSVPRWCAFRQKITPEEKARREAYFQSDRFNPLELSMFDVSTLNCTVDTNAEETTRAPRENSVVIIEPTPAPPEAAPPPLRAAADVTPSPSDRPQNQQTTHKTVVGVSDRKETVVSVDKKADVIVDKDDTPAHALEPSDRAEMAQRTLALNLAYLANASNTVLEHIVDVGSALAPGTPEADRLMSIMDVVMNMDSSIALCQQAIVHTGLTAMNTARLSAAERAELEQARRDRAAWEQKIAQLEEQNALLARSCATTPSSGFSSAAHSPHSEETDGGGPEEQAAPAAHDNHHQAQMLAEMDVDEDIEEEEEVVEGEATLEYPAPALVTPQPPPKPERSKRVLFSARSPQLMGEQCSSPGTTFKDSLRRLNAYPPYSAQPAQRTLSTSFLEDTIELSDSPEEPNEGPLCSTFLDGDRLAYMTPPTSKKMRRRSSSIGDAMSTVKRLFTPKRKVKNPIFE